MYDIDFAEKMDSLMENEEIVEKLAAAGSEEELAALFVHEGLILSQEDIKKIFSEIRIVEDSGELSEDALDFVSGGGLSLTALILGGAGVSTTIVVACAVYYIGKAIIDKKCSK